MNKWAAYAFIRCFQMLSLSIKKKGAGFHSYNQNLKKVNALNTESVLKETRGLRLKPAALNHQVTWKAAKVNTS
jgi:hypothetical protein